MMNETIKHTKLSHIASVRLGHPFRGRIQEVANGSAQVIQLRNITQELGVNWSELIRTEAQSKREPQWLQAGDVLVVARGYHNHVVYLDTITEQTLCSPHFYVVHPLPESGLDSEFLAWQLNQTVAQNHFKQAAAGSRLPSLTRRLLEQTPVVVPPMKDQNTVVKLARAAQKEKQTIQALIHNRERQMMAVASRILS
jgi:hypothetical protein